MDSTRSAHDLTGDGIAIVIRIGRLTYGHVELSGVSDILLTAISIWRCTRLMEEPHDRGPIEPTDEGLRPRSTHDRGPIASRSWLDRGVIVAPLRQKSRLIHLLIGSHDVAKWNRPHDAFNPCPRPDETAPIFGPIFPLKTHVFPLFVLQLLIDSWRN